MKLAVIPARGGSKRIPRKNIRPFAGRPIIAYSIEAALESGLFDRIIVSTDDAEIAEVARKWRAETPFVRPAPLADDHTPVSAVVTHAVRWAIGERIAVSHACCIYATAPFVQPADLRRAFEMLRASGRGYALSITSYPFPIQRSIRLTRAGGIEPMFPERILERSQDLEDAYRDAGQFFWGTAEAFLGDVPIFSAAAIPVILSSHLVQDIDTPEDWRSAELLYRAWQTESKETGCR
jgi:N-acylneuraminate cytidylyltransferase